MRFVLDTDHISILQRKAGTGFVPLSLRMAAHPFDEFAVSIVSFHEQVIGSHAYINGARRPSDVIRGYAILGRVIREFTEMPVLLFDQTAAARFDDLASRRLRVATMDLRIASIALARGLILLTRNVRDFARVPGLVTEDWTW